jgi:hypothetical protein
MQRRFDVPIVWYYYANNYHICRIIVPIVWYLTFLSGGCSTSVEDRCSKPRELDHCQQEMWKRNGKTQQPKSSKHLQNGGIKL